MNDITYFDAINGLMMWGTLALQAGVIVLLLAFLKVPGFSRVRTFVDTYGITISTLLVFASMLGSLYYSSIVGFAPCLLCWYQRIFFFSQLPLFIVALARKTRDVVPYTTTLSVIGACIAVYQVILERIPALAGICGLDASEVSCGTIYVEGFSYITIPVMGLTAFAALVLIGFMLRKDGETA